MLLTLCNYTWPMILATTHVLLYGRRMRWYFALGLVSGVRQRSLYLLFSLSLDKREHEKQEKPRTKTMLGPGRAECLRIRNTTQGDRKI